MLINRFSFTTLADNRIHTNRLTTFRMRTTWKKIGIKLLFFLHSSRILYTGPERTSWHSTAICDRSMCHHLPDMYVFITEKPYTTTTTRYDWSIKMMGRQSANAEEWVKHVLNLVLSAANDINCFSETGIDDDDDDVVIGRSNVTNECVRDLWPRRQTKRTGCGPAAELMKQWTVSIK